MQQGSTVTLHKNAFCLLEKGFSSSVCARAMEPSQDADPIFLSPESTGFPQVMSPMLPATTLEGEDLGPDYGSVGRTVAPTALTNGVPGTSEISNVTAAVHGSGGGLDTGGCGVSGHDTAARSSGPETSEGVTGLDGARHAVGIGASGSSFPPAGVGVFQQSQPQRAAPPPQTPPTLPQQTPQHLTFTHAATTFTQQQQGMYGSPQQTFESGQSDQGGQSQSQQAPLLQQAPVRSPWISNLAQPEPPATPSPSLQAMRSLTTQMTSVAAAMSHRMQPQSVSNQGNLGVREDAEIPGFHVEVSGGSYGSESDPPPIPQHLRSSPVPDQARVGVLAGLARAGQALRRRVVQPMMQQVNRSPVQYSSPNPRPGDIAAPQQGPASQEESVFVPGVAEAMRELTQRPSLISPVFQGRHQGREAASTSSLSSELVREEVRRQVQLAMTEKNNEVHELRQQNEALRKMMAEQGRPQSVGGCARAQEVPVRGHEGRASQEYAQAPAAQDLGDRGAHDDLQRLFQGAGNAGRNPLGAWDRCKVPAGNLGGLPDPRVRDGGRSGLEGNALPSSSGPMHVGSGNNSSATSDDPLKLLVQGMRQLQQAYIGKTDSKDTEFKGSAVIPEMPDVGAESSVAFADWLYELEQVIGGLSDKASVWFAACLSVATKAYTEYTLASPVARLSIQPRIPDELKDEKWSRLERRVMTLLLGSMKKAAKDDAITHRILDVPSLLYRLHVLYQPGGISERTAILKHLEGKSAGENVHECITALRKWRRYIERAESMRVTVPDPSILLGAVELMVKKVLDAHPEVKFRVALMRNELQLQGNPTVEGILRFHTHILAELQMVAPVQEAGLSTTLKALEGTTAGTGESSSPSRSPARKGRDNAVGSKVPCKFFMSKTECSRGANCKFNHAFESREDKKTRCWECGSTLHRRSECPTKKPSSPKKSDDRSGAAASASSMVPPPLLQQQAVLESIQQSQAQPSGPGVSARVDVVTAQPASTSSATGEAKDAEVKELLKEANAMLSKLAKLQTMEVQTNESVGRLSAAMKAAGISDGEGSALLDSGASHAFRSAKHDEAAEASPVRVELAGGQYVTLKQNKAGTLLATADDPNAQNATPILPLGALVQRLGCDLRWTRKGSLNHASSVRNFANFCQRKSPYACGDPGPRVNLPT